MATSFGHRPITDDKSRSHVGTSLNTSDLLTIEVSSDAPSTSTSVDPSPAGAAPTLTPVADGEKKTPNVNGKVPSEDRTRPKKAPRRAPRPTGEEDNGPRKSNRVTRNRDDPSSVVNNYVDSNDLKQPRRVQPPIGAVRIPFVLPKLDLEKEKDKLKIHMIGPKTRKREDSASKYMTDANKQADFSPYLNADFVAPPTVTEEDRDELVWKNDDKLELELEQMDLAWSAIRRQFKGTIPLDAVMRRLMNCSYSVEDMLSQIEMEQFERLSQPFEPLSFAQQAEFQRLLRKAGNPSGKHRGGEKIFRMFQEKFLKNYYSGEIINYYYNTKHKGCQHHLYNRCSCLENLTNEPPAIPRYQCFNCTKYLHKEHGEPKTVIIRCTVCETFKRLYGTERNPLGGLFPKDEEIAKIWLECEQLLMTTKIDTLKKVKEDLEKERRKKIAEIGTEEVPPTYINGRLIKLTFDQICKKSQKFEPHRTHRCSMLRPWGNKLIKKELQRFNTAESLEIVKAFQKHGLIFHKVAAEVKKPEEEISLFYNLYRQKYRIDEIADKSIAKKSFKRSSNHNPSIQRISQEDDRSVTQSPEPRHNSRRKRAVSEDPLYSDKTHAPVEKIRRRTRQSAADEIQINITEGA